MYRPTGQEDKSRRRLATTISGEYCLSDLGQWQCALLYPFGGGAVHIDRCKGGRTSDTRSKTTRISPSYGDTYM